MVYLAKRLQAKKTYYYLVENIPLGSGKRKQLRAYLGNEKPSELILRHLMKQFEAQVEQEQYKLHGFHYLTSDEIKETDKINREFWARYNSVNEVVQEQFDENFVITFVHNTNSIEGSTLTPKEVALLLTENIAPNKPLDDVLEAKAGQKTLNFVKEHTGNFNEEFLLKIHEMYFKETKPSIAGAYKKYANYIRTSAFQLTAPELVPKELNDYFNEYEKLSKQLHPLELAAWAHWKLVRIHPFQDGNGRAARIVMNYILHRQGYGMIDIQTKEKQVYFKTLEKCNYNNNARALAVRLVRRFKKQYQNAFK
ncbi:MAG: Fic family protein [Candidatus Diapherotrites archaeon]|nr:Fic family protein [Candidatus Diapherotrites archaeon]